VGAGVACLSPPVTPPPPPAIMSQVLAPSLPCQQSDMSQLLVCVHTIWLGRWRADAEHLASAAQHPKMVEFRLAPHPLEKKLGPLVKDYM
jgi:hypothetical protein